MELIISGGQTGADLGALTTGVALGIPTAGYAPKGFLTEIGPDPSLAKYGILEAETDDYAARDVLNVDMCNGLVAFLFNVPMTGRGSEKTINYALTGEQIPGRDHLARTNGDTCTKIGNHPVLVIYDLDVAKINILARALADFIRAYNVTKLMVSGPQQSTFIATINMEETVQDLLIATHKLLKST